MAVHRRKRNANARPIALRQGRRHEQRQRNEASFLEVGTEGRVQRAPCSGHPEHGRQHLWQPDGASARPSGDNASGYSASISLGVNVEQVNSGSDPADPEFTCSTLTPSEMLAEKPEALSPEG